MKFIFPLLLLAGVVSAGETLFTTVGDSLEAIVVRADPASLKAGTPEELAASYARYIVGQREAIETFGRLFRKAHMGILEHYYAPDVVEKQRAEYAKKPKPVTCAVERVKKAEGKSWAWVLRKFEGKGLRMKLAMEQRNGRWWITRISHQQKNNKYIDAGLGVPPKNRVVHVPKPGAIKRTSPEATMQSLRTAMLRLRSLKQRGDNRLAHASVQVLTVLLGKESVAREQARERKDPLPKKFTVSLPSDPIDGVVRMGVVATEPVPGVKGQTTAIGHAGFDLKKDDAGDWRVTGELTRDEPDAPLQPLTSYFGLFFLR